MGYPSKSDKSFPTPRRVSRGDPAFKGRVVHMHSEGSLTSVSIPGEELHCDRCGKLLDGDEVWIIDHDAYCETCKKAWDIRVGAVLPAVNMVWAGTHQAGFLFDGNVLMLAGPSKPPIEKAVDKFTTWAGEALHGCFILVGDWVGWGDFDEGAVVVSALFPSSEALESVEESLSEIYEQDGDPEIVCVLHPDELWRQALRPHAWVRADGALVRLESETDWTTEAKALYALAMRGGGSSN